MAYNELIKNFNKVRDYMRDFYLKLLVTVNLLSGRLMVVLPRLSVGESRR